MIGNASRPGAIALAALALALPLAGLGACNSARTESGPEPPESPATDAESAVSDTVPPADPGQALADAQGREPADAFAEHMAAVATGDAAAVWDTYGGTPPADYETWAAEWSAASEVYENSTVLEQRVVGEGRALVRVTYDMNSTEGVVSIVEPGEWWSIVIEDGLWKVAWLPRQ